MMSNEIVVLRWSLLWSFVVGEMNNGECQPWFLRPWCQHCCECTIFSEILFPKSINFRKPNQFLVQLIIILNLITLC
jgi:hypothetical protein